MKKAQGFSLTEVLVSLLLISATVLAVLTQQWRLATGLNQLIDSLYSLIEYDNEKEQQKAIYRLNTNAS